MAKALVIYAHPRPDRSEINGPLFETAKAVQGVTPVDLYAEYPDFDIDVDREQQRLVEHDVIVFQHPLYWYSAPAIMKEWQDLVLEHGFAYGKHGTALAGKTFMNAITAGAKPDAYSQAGLNHADLRSLLLPFEATAHLCGMRYLAPFALFGAGRASEGNQLDIHRNAYDDLLKALVADRLDFEKAAAAPFLGDVLDEFLIKTGAM
ncbi:flavodoxin family protein [Roseibium denhamense]|uniref:Kef-type potassium/proton antiporter accessory protein, CPA2 family n=1 Tax=Roseibium denhamense TaxID=76305 RepID=A0ABY1NIF3_9HYPH|nr:NAD(P)H-dependent oxidoreductase [Roseibium denhamense]MTI05069.1 flavodoxin family protein [Roseibium denhamense]SMP10202.1 Kef-type potassium/proton antiporter accessory protein, CPA2 family [Roseibium denhamense]